MKAKYDQEDIEITTRFDNALIELMQAECEMMQQNEPDHADCWTWGRCRVGDLAYLQGLSCSYGGEEDKPLDGLGDFGIIYEEINEEV